MISSRSRMLKCLVAGEFLQSSIVLLVISLVLHVCGLSLYSPKESERVSGKLFPIKDLWSRVWQTLQVFMYTVYTVICTL